jgi:L-methionine (R)-S-oxide reductase
VKTHDDLLREVQDLATFSPDPKTLMQRIADRLHAILPRYNNVIFRVVEDSQPGVLLLGPYTGSFKPHPQIPMGQGLSGTAASEGKTIVVDNVAADSRYLAGSFMVKSEIVVPIFVGGRLAGEMDVQSYFVDTFKTSHDRQFVESCAGLVAKHMEEHRKKR